MPPRGYIVTYQDFPPVDAVIICCSWLSVSSSWRNPQGDVRVACGVGVMTERQLRDLNIITRPHRHRGAAETGRNVAEISTARSPSQTNNEDLIGNNYLNQVSWRRMSILTRRSKRNRVTKTLWKLTKTSESLSQTTQRWRNTFSRPSPEPRTFLQWSNCTTVPFQIEINNFIFIYSYALSLSSC